MHAVVITEPGGPEVLQWTEVDDPVPGQGEVLVDVVAGGVNRADLMQRQGFYPPPPGAPPYPGLECSGTIAAVGPGVTGWQVGDAVCALLAGGGYAEKVAVPAGQLLPAPASTSLTHAAGLPETVCTVYSNVFLGARLSAGRDAPHPRRRQRHRHDGDPAREALRRDRGGDRRLARTGWRPAGNSARTSRSTTATRTSCSGSRTPPAATART